jgi:hypothetical protein
MGLAQHSIQIGVERRDEFERGPDHERVMPGLAAAGSRGPVGGRPKALNRKRLQHVRESASAGVPVAEITMRSSSRDRPLRSAAGPATSRSPTICTAAWASD